MNLSYATDGAQAGKIVSNTLGIIKVSDKNENEYYIDESVVKYLSYDEYINFIPGEKYKTVIENKKFDAKLPAIEIENDIPKRRYRRKTVSVKVQSEKIVKDYFHEGKDSIINRIKKLGVKHSVASVYYYTFKPKKRRTPIY